MKEDNNNILLQRECGSHAQQAKWNFKCGIKKSSYILGLIKTVTIGDDPVPIIWRGLGDFYLPQQSWRPSWAGSIRSYGKQGLEVALFLLYSVAKISFLFPMAFFTSLIISDGVKARP